MRIRTIVLVLLLLSPVVRAEAQCTPPPSPGAEWVLQDCGWLPPGHPGIRYTAPTSVTDCRVLSPYSQPDLLKACLDAAPKPAPVLPTLTGCDHTNPYTNAPATDCAVGVYRVGRVYWFTDVERAQVIGVTQDARGVEVVTVQFLDELGAHRGGPDQLFTFRNDGTFRPWVWLAENRR